VHRLLGADLPGTANDVAYTYDGVDNHQTEETEAASRYYVYGTGNRLREIHEGSEAGELLRSFTYSDAGEVESKRDGSGDVIYALQRGSQGRVIGVRRRSLFPAAPIQRGGLHQYVQLLAE